ncbi:AAA family ATPase [Cognatishimia sp.]|uniref:phosphatase domain-containing protein n=1 Tax=Cognatishimia sp. TaxID=2211648 RepID=UPI003514DFE3|nr:AAA family ATPase [Cognatishimia sp.]
MVQTLYFLKGLPASGKSTWAKNKIDSCGTNQIKRVNKDDLREMLDNGRHSKGNEKLVIDLRNHIVTTALLSGKHVIVDDTNLNPVHEECIKKIIEEVNTLENKNIKFELVEFNTPIDECIKRDNNREKSVGEQVIRRMANESNSFGSSNIRPYTCPYTAREGGKQDCIVVDLDGTVAYNNGHRGWYDGAKVYGDDVKYPIRDIVLGYKEFIFLHGGYDIKLIFVTARQTGVDNICQKETVKWIDEKLLFGHENHQDYLLQMRKQGDNRKDCIVKKEIYENYIEPYYSVLCVFDDRDQVVNMWRDLGLMCLQVDKGDF